MKWILRTLLISITTALVLAACTPEQAATTPTVEAPTTEEAEADTSQAEPPAAQAVSNDRKPQFLNSYADW